jgi:hypothetical protein
MTSTAVSAAVLVDGRCELAEGGRWFDTLTVHTAESGPPSEEFLHLLDSWATTQRATAVSSPQPKGH